MLNMKVNKKVLLVLSLDGDQAYRQVGKRITLTLKATKLMIFIREFESQAFLSASKYIHEMPAHQIMLKFLFSICDSSNNQFGCNKQVVIRSSKIDFTGKSGFISLKAPAFE